MARAPIHEAEANERRGRWFVAVAILLSIAIISSTWVGLFSFMWANAAHGSFSDLEDKYIPDTEGRVLDLPDPSLVSVISAGDGTKLAELHDGRITQPVRLEEVPERVIYAMLAAEDADFYEHEGIDFTAIFSAAVDNLVSDQRRGGSTITQQVVKKVFVGNDPTIQRKIEEAFIAAELERRFSKDQILEYYINSVYFGSSAYGISAAASEFYDKSLNQLQVDEAATLAVLVRNPFRYDPRRRPEDTKDRRDQVLDQMVEEGWLTKEAAAAAKKRPIDVVLTPTFTGPADHVAAEVKRQLLNEPRFGVLGATKEERKRAIFGCPADAENCDGGGGLTISTTLDLNKQNAANAILQTWFPLLPPEENLAQCLIRYADDSEEFLAVFAQTHPCTPVGAIATVDNATGAVLAMASGLPFDFNQFDLAVQGRRNPGSAFKVFALVAALENGISMGSVWSGATPRDIICPSVCGPDGSRIWKVHNAGAGYGNIDLGTATYNSVNTVYAQLIMQVGVEKVIEVAHRMGIQSDLFPNPSLVLGSDAVTPLEMASAFSNFATDGLWAEPYLISRIEDSTGKVIYEHVPQPRQVVDPSVVAAARQPLLKVPTAEGTAERANIERSQGGKTGTHQEYRDAWYVGFTPEYSTAVWVGFEGEQIPLRNVIINGRQYDRVFGGTVPAPIWAEYMKAILAEAPDAGFPPDPPGLELFLDPPLTRVPSVVGLTEQQARDRMSANLLHAAVQAVGSLEPAGVVVAQGAAPGAKIPQGTGVLVQVSNGTPPSAPLPELTGLYLETALAELRTFQNLYNVRLNVLIVHQPVTDPAQLGLVVSTTPLATEYVGRGTTVTLVVGQ